MVKVAVSTAGSKQGDNKVFQKLLQERAKKEGLEITWLDAQHDVIKQGEDLQKAVREEVKLVVVEPVDAEMLKNSLMEIQKKGIGIIVLNTLPPEMGVEAYLTPDYRRAGEMQAQQLIQQATTDRPLDVLVLRGGQNSRVAQEITAGNLQVLKDNDRIRSLLIEEIENPNAAAAFDQVKKHLSSGNPPQAILAHSPELTAGMLEALKAAGQEGQVKTFGLGTDKKAIEAMKKGMHQGEIDFMPDMLAQLVIQTAQKVSRNEPWEYETQVQNGSHNVPTRYTPIRSITPENVDLLKEKLKLLAEDSAGGSKEQGSAENGAGEGEGGSGEGQNKDGSSAGKTTVVTIKTKNGQTFEMNINGEIESIEIKGKEKGTEEG